MNDQNTRKPENEEKVQIDRDALNATLNSWLMPGTTGNLVDTAAKKKEKEQKKGSEKSSSVIYLGDGKKE